MAEEKNTTFNYLLNAVMHAGQEAHPAKAGYAGKYKALIAHVRELERKAAAYDALVASGAASVSRPQAKDTPSASPSSLPAEQQKGGA